MSDKNINKLGLQNFRIFKDYAEFKFKPLTILTGPNNSGKSSFLLALDLIKSFGQRNNAKDEKNYDVLASLELTRQQKFKYGSFKQIINNKSHSSLISFETDFHSELFPDENLRVKLTYQPDTGLSNPYERMILKHLIIYYKTKVLFEIKGKYEKYKKAQIDVLEDPNFGHDAKTNIKEVKKYIYEFTIKNKSLWEKHLKNKMIKEKISIGPHIWMNILVEKYIFLEDILKEHDIYFNEDLEDRIKTYGTKEFSLPFLKRPGYYFKNDDTKLHIEPKCISKDLQINVYKEHEYYKYNKEKPDKLEEIKVDEIKVNNFCEKIFLYPTLEKLKKLRIKDFLKLSNKEKELLKKELGEDKSKLLMKLSYLGLHNLNLIDKVIKQTEDKLISLYLNNFEYDLHQYKNDFTNYIKDNYDIFELNYPFSKLDLTVKYFYKYLNPFDKKKINSYIHDNPDIYIKKIIQSFVYPYKKLFPLYTKELEKILEKDKHISSSKMELEEIKALFKELFLDETELNQEILKKMLEIIYKSIVENTILKAFDIWFEFNSNISQHFSPLRAEMSRVFSFDKNNFTVEFYEQLNKLKKEERQKRMDFINHWLKEFKIADAITFQEIEGGGGFQIFITKDGRKILLADNGYGLNQLIPVMLAISVGQDKVIIVEEPEANLHPAFQSKLANMFVDANKKFKTRFVLETHSEYLIRSLQVLIAKKTILNTKVNIFYINSEVNPEDIQEEGRKKIYQMKIDENGLMINGFGKGFFDEASNLSLMLLKTISKN